MYLKQRHVNCTRFFRKLSFRSIQFFVWLHFLPSLEMESKIDAFLGNNTLFCALSRKRFAAHSHSSRMTLVKVTVYLTAFVLALSIVLVNRPTPIQLITKRR